MSDLVKEKMKMVIISRSMGVIQIHTYELEEVILGKLFPDRSKLVMFEGLTTDTSEPANHYYNTDKEGDIGMIVFTIAKNRQIIPVQAQVTGRIKPS